MRTTNDVENGAVVAVKDYDDDDDGDDDVEVSENEIGNDASFDVKTKMLMLDYK